MLLGMISQAGLMGPIDFIAMILGKFIEWIYELLSMVGVHNAALSIIIFTIASILCGFANSMPMMLFSRIIQGIGGGGIMPISQAVIFEIFPKEKLPQAMAVFGLGVIMAPILGPAVGGWITENWSWPFIYFINILLLLQ